jgi:ArpU family phage transcriptional regulator
LKVWMENQKEVIQAEADGPLFPILSKTEKQNELKYKQIQRTLDFALDDIEREIITQKYLDPSRPTDLFIYLELGMKKEAYYKKKKSAIYSMAKALGII